MTASILTWVLLLQSAGGVQPGTISGRLQMADGTPAAAVRVAAIPAPPPNIRPVEGQNYYASQPPANVTLTDGEGRYRLANVRPGRYYIIAGPAGQGTYYPATTEIDAAGVVTIEPGSPAVAAVDFRLLTFPGSVVRGAVTPPPAPDENEIVVLSGVGLGELLETPVRRDGSFEFGRVPPGEYLLSLFPPPAGMPSVPFRIDEQDAISVPLARPALYTVSGRIVAQNGPLPRALLGFSTQHGYVRGTIRDDGTFEARLHAARHQVELGGMPVGYSVASVRVGADDVTAQGVTVSEGDISDVTITVAAPPMLPRVRGRLVGLDGRTEGARVEITGPIVGRLEATVAADGTFGFPAVTPGMYRVTVPALPEIAPTWLVVDSSGAEVELTASR